MAFHIDLLHEHHQQELERRTDPLRIGILGLLVVAIALVSLYMVRSAGFNSLQNQRNALSTQWAQKEPMMEEARVEEQRFLAEIQASEALLLRAESRFYWGPLLEQVLKSIPKEIQIKALSGVTDRTTRSLTLTLTGVGAGVQPRQDAENFRQALLNRMNAQYPKVTAEFVTLEDDPLRVNLDNRTLATARFRIKLQVEYKTAEAPPQ